MPTTASYSLELYYSAAWHTVAAGDVLEVSGSWEISGNRNNAIAFGDDTDASLTARFVYGVWAHLSHLGPIRYTTTNSGDSTTRTFTGVVTKLHRTLDDCDVEASGVKVLIAAKKIYSPPFARRPIATKTTASSGDDITSPAYLGGLINYALWSAGGRPYEQAGSYPSAVFYYSCEQSILAPDWSHLAGEDTWEECLTASRASGGQMYQDNLGVVRFKEILGYGGASAAGTLDESDYATIEETTDPDVQQGDKWTCQYIPRRRLGTQEIANDTTPYHVEPVDSVTIVVEPQNPLAALETNSAGTQLLPEALVVSRQDGARVSPGVSGYTHTLDFKAAKITIVVTNATAFAFTIWRVVLRGDPIVPTEAGSATDGSGSVERQIEQSYYLQTRADALRMAQMYSAFYSQARANVSLSSLVHIPSRYVGQTIGLSCSAWGMVDVPHVVLKIDHSQTGIEAALELASVEDLPDPALFFVVGTSYSSGQDRYLAW